MPDVGLKPALVEVWDVLRHWVEPFVPAAVGAAIGQMWEKGLSWRDRLLQWTVGLSVAVFVVPAIAHVFGWGQPLERAVGFVVATIAFKAYVPLREAAIAGMSGGLRSLPEIFRSWTRRPGSAAEPPRTEGEGG